MNTTVFNSVVKKLETAKDIEGNLLNMDSIIVSEGGYFFRDKYTTYKHNFKSGNGLNEIRSISKPIVSMAVGIAIDNGLQLRKKKVDLETDVWQFLDGKVKITNTKNTDRLRRIKLKHLLTHTYGFDVGLMFSKDIKDIDPYSLLEYVFNHDLVYEPGKHFVYSNVGPYVISAIIQEELGLNLSEFVKRVLFQKIGISNFEWKNYGKYCAGSSGLKLSNEDMHKIGLVLLQDGKYKGKQIVSKKWVELMKKPQVLTPSMYDEKRVFPKYAYGYYLWICKNGSYYCDGTDGQYLIVLPKKRIVITTFGHQSDMKPITECLRELL